MKYGSYRRLMAVVTAIALTVSMSGCNGTSQKQEETGQAVLEQESSEKPEEETKDTPEEESEGEAEEAPKEEAGKEKTDITISAEEETASTVNGLDDGLCSWTTEGTEAGTVNGDDYAFRRRDAV